MCFLVVHFLLLIFSSESSTCIWSMVISPTVQYSRICIFLSFYRRAEKPKNNVCGTHDFLGTLCATNMTFYFFDFVKVVHSLFWNDYFMKKCRKICSLMFAKNMFSAKMVWNKSQNSKKVVCGTHNFLGLFLVKQEKFMCTYNILFLEFHKYYWFFKYKLFMKMCRIICHFIFSKIVNLAHGAYDYIVYSTDLAICVQPSRKPWQCRFSVQNIKKQTKQESQNRTKNKQK